MWTIGHCCLGYLLTRPMYGRKPIIPVVLLSIYFMAAVPDFAHLYVLRTVTHSLIFLVPFSVLLIWLIARLGILERSKASLLFIASLSHILGDLMFGSFAFFYPFSTSEVSWFPWGSYLDLAFEIALFGLMLLALHFTGDLKARATMERVIRKETRRQRLYKEAIMGGFVFVLLAQIGAVVYLDFMGGPNFYNNTTYNDGSMWYVSLAFILAQIAFVYMLLHFLLSRIELRKLHGITWRMVRNA